MTKARVEAVSGLVAALSGAWRHIPPELQCSVNELDVIASLLIHSGVGALGWWRIQHSQLQHSQLQLSQLQLSQLRFSPAVMAMRHIYGVNTLRAKHQEEEIENLVPLLHSVGVDPLLVKGWAVARMYPEPGLRPYGDIDLCIRPEQYPAAEDALKRLGGMQYDVDLHKGFRKLDLTDEDDLYERSQVVKMGQVDVRVPCLEDHLRILCFHLLRHGVSRPLWLCDIALLMESRPPDFDWQICLGKDQRRADWVACAIGLAHQLLGIKVDETPVAKRAKRLPRWLVPSVLKQWRSPKKPLTPAIQLLRRPLRIPTALYDRWPNPIEATIGIRSSFNEWPRLPFQFSYSLSRVTKFLLSLPETLREDRIKN